MTSWIIGRPGHTIAQRIAADRAPPERPFYSTDCVY